MQGAQGLPHQGSTAFALRGVIQSTWLHEADYIGLRLWLESLDTLDYFSMKPIHKQGKLKSRFSIDPLM